MNPAPNNRIAEPHDLNLQVKRNVRRHKYHITKARKSGVKITNQDVILAERHFASVNARAEMEQLPPTTVPRLVYVLPSADDT
jgi:hypothetical protein